MAQKNCLFLANAVGSGTELVDYLNAIISGVIIGATFIVWLLLTKLASTKVLVVIASPLVAASFIFGDTCKNLFQSIIFVYVLHPLDVGDSCDIHEDHKVSLLITFRCSGLVIHSCHGRLIYDNIQNVQKVGMSHTL